MFLKPFRIKTQTSIKGSDRKKLRADVGRQFGVDANMLMEMIPNKEEMTIMKVFTHSGETPVVYNIQGNPAYFELNQILYPTVYTLWKYPDLLHVFPTWPPVFKKLQGGADLMLPGVIVKGPVTPTYFGNLKRGDQCSIKLLGNKAPVAVGKVALSAGEMYECAMRGKGVVVLHSYTDQLWAFGNKSDPPLIEDLEMLQAATSGDSDSDVENGVEGVSNDAGEGDRSDELEAKAAGGTITDLDQLSLDDRTQSDTSESEEEEDPKIVQERMDDLLSWCFMCALKTRVKKSDLPLLTSNFFRNHLQPSCPSGKTVDVKKSSFKKLSKFLKGMQDRGFLVVKELSKGVESIVEIVKDHPELREFTAPEPVDQEEEPSACGGAATNDYKPPEITAMFTITAASAEFFKLCGRRKGNALSAVEVRKCLTDYIKETELTAPQGYVRLDPILSDLVLTKVEYQEQLLWEDVIARTLGRMSPAYRMTFPGQDPVIKKGKLEPIVLNIAQRGGNKKVTLLHNLEVYGIDPNEFAHQVQIGRACSTSVSALPGKNQGLEVLIQGNQINFISDMLINKYKIPRKYLAGLEKAPKSGKKKR